MKILIAGNLGYVGPGVVREFRKYYPDSELVGLDTGYFSKHVTTDGIVPECFLDQQIFCDIRKAPESLFEGVQTVVNLAAISNDPIGNKFESPTLDINYKAAVDIARKAKRTGVRSYVYASSCSVYGAAEDAPRTENSAVNPLTAYAKSKVYTENALADLADKNFNITCHRFATACGMSDRLRLDLVLNDFVACAITSGEITILSDGSPWRPLINVLDMATAIRWSHDREVANGGEFLIVNTGSDEWNYRVIELAEKIRELYPQVKVSVNKNATPDKRSYRVDFNLFKKLAPNYQPVYDLTSSIKGLYDGLMRMNFNDHEFRNSHYMRLHVVTDLVRKNIINHELYVNQ